MKTYELKVEQMTFLSDPSFRKVWSMNAISDADFSSVIRVNENQLRYLLLGYARFDALLVASTRGFVKDRDMSTLVPKGLRAEAIADMVEAGLLERSERTPNAWVLTREGRAVILQAS